MLCNYRKPDGYGGVEGCKSEAQFLLAGIKHRDKLEYYCLPHLVEKVDAMAGR